MPKFNYDPSKDIPSLEGKVILVTGGTSGLGQQTVVHLAQHSPSHIFFTGRSQSSAERTINLARDAAPSVPVTFISCDLSSLTSVRSGAQTLLSQTSRLDILYCNAGIMAVPAGVTADGYEVQFGTNHMGHALLVKLLEPLLRTTAGLPGVARGTVRVVVLSSQAYSGHPPAGIKFETLKGPQTDLWPMGGWMRYSQSKLANLLYAKALAKRLAPDVTVVAVHPGVIMTPLVTNLNWKHVAFVNTFSFWKQLTPEQGAWNSLWCGTAPGVQTGKYYEPVGEDVKPARRGSDDALAEKLWEWTEEELKSWVKV